MRPLLFFVMQEIVFAVRERQRGCSRSAALLFVFDNVVVRERQMACCCTIMKKGMGVAFLQLDCIGREILCPACWLVQQVAHHGIADKNAFGGEA